MKNIFLCLMTVILTCLNFSACSPKKPIKKVLVLGRGGDSVGLDPAKETDGESFKVCDNIFDTLVQYKEGGTDIIPNLAEKWEVSPDGLSYTFYLRANVKFHDGTPVNADAVLFSFDRQRLKDHPFYKVGGAWQYWEAMGMSKIVKQILKVSDTQVTFILHQPESPFLANLGMNFASIVSPTAVQKHGADFSRNPVGSGPFKFKRWVKNELVELEANPEYYEGKPKLEGVIFRSIPDNSARLLELLSGKIDMMDYPNPSDIAKIEQNPMLKVLKAPGMNVGYLAMHTQKKPFNDVRVRQALNHAINKKSIVDNLYEGLGTPAVNALPPNMWGYWNENKGYEYNPEKAKALLKEAGLEKGFSTELYTIPVARPYMPNGRKVAEAIQSDLKAIGVEIKLVTFEWGTYLDKLSKGEHSMALIGWSGDNGDPDNFLYILLDKTSVAIPAQNFAFFVNEQLHSYLTDAKKTADQKLRTDLYVKAQQLIHQEAPWVPVAHSVEVLPMKKTVQGMVIDPTAKRRFYKVSLE